ncbi:malonyl-CoA decarboxylase [Coralliovum pocilloporae]|uniref:malonyl-CoA decarboxylase n=1 Tax=Coralliovum pocilloporae TaxID=3066369 RepID=UPI003307B197
MNSLFTIDMLSTIAERGRRMVGLDRERRLSAKDMHSLADELLSKTGEAGNVARADDLLCHYSTLDSAACTGFFRALLTDFDVDRDKLTEAAETYLADQSARNQARLRDASEPRRAELLRRLNMAPDGTRHLVQMRADLLQRLKSHADLKTVDDDFARLFTAWFNRGFLVLRRIDWQTPAAILEKIITYEAVHAIQDWDDLRRRIDLPDRRLYAFFHPALVDDPLIFVEVALTRDIPDRIAGILADDRDVIEPEKAGTAVFYSISNCQEGLKGVSFGNFLIKQVVEELSRELPNLKNFVTLSPIPGFRQWLSRQSSEKSGDNGDSDDDLLQLLNSRHWMNDPGTEQALKDLLMPLAAHYFLAARDHRGRVPDPVARFHLGNGARLERLNWLGDVSDRGLDQSAGLMVNYLYDRKDIEANHEAFSNDGVIASDAAVRKLAKAVKS